MKNIFLISTIAVMALLSACTSDDLVSENVELKEGTEASIPEMPLEEGTRSELVYNNGSMKFAWHNGDRIAIYPVSKAPDVQGFNGDENSPLTIYSFVSNSSVAGKNSVTGKFGSTSSETTVLEVAGSDEFYAWFPYRDSDPRFEKDEDKCMPNQRGSTDLKVNYNNQIQASNVKLSYYGKSNALYEESERAASAHLGEYDYLYSSATQLENSYTHFEFQHAQATVRFFMKVPHPDEDQIFDSLLVFRSFENAESQYKFTTKGEFNLATKILTPTEQPVKLKLKLGENGFDLIDRTGSDDPEAANYNPRYGKTSNDYLYKNNYVMIAYMAMAPVDLTHENAVEPTLYLCAHKGTGNDTQKIYYKASLSKKKIRAGYLYQWSYALDEEQPISFEDITVQQWEEETGYVNDKVDKEGKGTENW